MNIIKNNQNKNLKKRCFLVCCLAVFSFLQTPHLNASKSGEEDMMLNEPEERPIRANKTPTKFKSKSGCGGVDAEVKVPGFDAKISVKQANLKIKK